MRIERRARARTTTGLVVGILAMIAGCSDMKDQPHHEPLEKSTFFADGRSSRPLVEGTVARGHLRADDRIYLGLESNGHFVRHVPLPVDQALLERGQERYDIYCSPCHGRQGDGLGMIVRRGYKQPPSYHSERLRITQDGYLYNVISNGYGKMSSYAAQVKPMDRWAIVAYIRALQLSQFSELSSVDSKIQAQLRRGEVVDTREHEVESEERHHGTGH